MAVWVDFNVTWTIFLEPCKSYQPIPSLELSTTYFIRILTFGKYKQFISIVI